MTIIFTQKCSAKSCCENIAKSTENTCTRMIILIMLETLGQEEFNGEFKMFSTELETVWNTLCLKLCASAVF